MSSTKPRKHITLLRKSASSPTLLHTIHASCNRSSPTIYRRSGSVRQSESGTSAKGSLLTDVHHHRMPPPLPRMVMANRPTPRVCRLTARTIHTRRAATTRIHQRCQNPRSRLPPHLGHRRTPTRRCRRHIWPTETRTTPCRTRRSAAAAWAASAWPGSRRRTRSTRPSRRSSTHPCTGTTCSRISGSTVVWSRPSTHTPTGAATRLRRLASPRRAAARCTCIMRRRTLHSKRTASHIARPRLNTARTRTTLDMLATLRRR